MLIDKSSQKKPSVAITYTHVCYADFTVSPVTQGLITSSRSLHTSLPLEGR